MHATKQTSEQRIQQKIAITAVNVCSSTEDEMILGSKRMMATAQTIWKCEDLRITQQTPNRGKNEMNDDVKQIKP